MADVKQYLEELLTKAGVADEKRQALMTTLADDQVAKALEEDYLKGRLRQDEFSRKMDGLATKEKEYNEWYAKELVKYNEMVAKEQELNSKLQSLGQNPSEPDPKQFVSTPADVISKKDFEEALARQERQSIAVIKGVGKIQGEHWKTFGEPADLDAIEKIAVEQGLSLDNAYKVYREPMLREKTEAAAKEQIEKQVGERLREELAKRHLPVDTKPREFHPIFDREKDLQPGAPRPSQGQLRESFVQAYNEAAGK